MGRVSSFLAELRRRHVFRVAAWYGAVAWLVIQFAATVFPTLDMPAWTTKVVVVMMLLGYPLAMALAWAFDVTPAGGRPAEPATPEDRKLIQPPWMGLSLWFGLAAGVLLGAGALQAWHALTADGPTRGPVIAILPFDDLSGTADSYIAAGIHEETLIRLAQLPNLTVISRTSVTKFKRETRPAIPEIARSLGATHILLGSIAREGSRVRVRVQLIDALKDSHLWAEAYERQLSDIFALEADLAQQIAEALDITLSSGERDRLATRPTADPVAYDLYLRALAIERDTGVHGGAPLVEAYQAVLEHDPGFASAHARLSMLYTWQFAFGDRSADARRLAFDHAMRAVERAPESSDAVMAMASYHIRTYDYSSAESALIRAAALAPSNAEVHSYLAGLHRRLGRWDEANRDSSRAILLAPQDSGYVSLLSENLVSMRRFGEAAAVVASAHERIQNDPWLRFVAARVRWAAQCDDGGMRELVETAQEGDEAAIYARGVAYSVVGDWTGAAAAFRRLADESPEFHLWAAGALRHLQREDEARDAYLRVVRETRALISAHDEAPGAQERQALPRAWLAGALGALGERQDALATLADALRDLPLSRDAYNGDTVIRYAVALYALLDERDQLFASLDESLSRPTSIQRCDLLRDPDFAKYASDARFLRWVERDQARGG